MNVWSGLEYRERMEWITASALFHFEYGYDIDWEIL